MHILHHIYCFYVYIFLVTSTQIFEIAGMFGMKKRVERRGERRREEEKRKEKRR
jgi:hypothetical protein